MKKGVDFDHEQPRIGPPPSYILLKLIILVIAGIAVGLGSMTMASMIYKNSLLTRITTIAEAMDTEKVATVQASNGSDQTKNEYDYIREKLARVKAVNADVRFAYIMGQSREGSVFFVADSEPAQSPDHSAYGEEYPEASEELRGIFTKGNAIIEGPSKDSYGTWLSGLAPVTDSQSGKPFAIVGIDVPATTYALLLVVSGGIPLLLTMLATGILYIRYQNRRRHRANVQFRAEMISIASHELRTPLTGLRWSQESLMSGKLSPESQQRSMQIMYDSTIRLQESIEDILQLASMEAGKAKLFKKLDDVKVLLQGIIATQLLAAERKQVSVVMSPDWPERVMVECDVQRLKRVFHNLISNAIKYSNAGGTVTIGYKSTLDGHLISFQDHGIGIPAEEQQHVWDGFYRASNTTDRDITGTGMGLYLAREIVGQHGGKTWLESQVGQGTTIYVLLPDTLPAADIGANLKPKAS